MFGRRRAELVMLREQVRIRDADLALYRRLRLVITTELRGVLLDAPLASLVLAWQVSCPSDGRYDLLGPTLSSSPLRIELRGPAQAEQIR